MNQNYTIKLYNKIIQYGTFRHQYSFKFELMNQNFTDLEKVLFKVGENEQT